MKKFIAGSLCFLVLTVLHAQTEDDVLMRIGGQDILRSEFEHAYNKNKAQNKMLLTEFTQSFIHLKLQALEAQDRGLDTLASFREKMNELTACFNSSPSKVPASSSAKSRPQTRLAHLYIYLPQNASAKSIQTACDKMDSIYRAVSSGYSFDDCVCCCLAEPSCGIYAERAVLPLHHTMEDVECKIRSLQTGELSRPFVSPVGVHLIQVQSRDGEDAVCEVSENQPVDVDKRRTYLLAELKEALLQEALQKKQGTQRTTPEQLTSYFKKNKKQYAWELPHYKGGVLYCKDKSSAKAMEKLLKRLPMENWRVAVENYNQKHPDKQAKVECGLFQIGTNPAVDKVVFKQGSFLPPSDYPYVTALGKKLKKGPESYQDVPGQVENDYNAFRQAEEVAGWLKKYKVEINQEVLKTVNNH